MRITGRDNYARLGVDIGVDLLGNPDRALNEANAYKIMSYGMRIGAFTGYKLDNYITDTATDYINARRIVNGVDNAQNIANDASNFESILRASLVSTPTPTLTPIPTPTPTPAPTNAQTVITTTPCAISVSGKYVLGANLNNSSTTIPAITINAPNVNLDLHGYYVSGASNTESTNSVISVGDVANVTIHDGFVANDGTGIKFNGSINSRNYVVDKVTITHCYICGIYFGANAPGSVISGCILSGLGNSTSSSDVDVSGIFTGGSVHISHNSISNLTATGTGGSYGLHLLTDLADGNTIANCGVWIIFFGQGRYLNNLTSDCTTPFSGQGISASGNN